MGIRVVVVDDHPVVRQGLRIYLGLDPQLELIGEAVDAESGLDTVRQLRPDVVLMDLLMPGTGGLAAIPVIRRELPDTEVIALTSILEDTSVVQAIQAGAVGYLLKDTNPEEMVRAIKAAAAGQVQLSPRAAATLVREIRAPQGPEALTERETEVLRLLARGQSNKDMAHILGISDATVKTHVKNLLAKLGLTSRTQAALYALRIGLVTLDGVSPKP